MSEKKTVLIVEDEKPLQNAIKIKLEKHGLATLTARTAEQALGHIEDVDIDGVWLDHYLLGQHDGLYIVGQMKSEDSKWKHIPIFVVSNTATEDKVNTYLKFGVEKYYTKAENKLEDIIADVSSTLMNKNNSDI